MLVNLLLVLLLLALAAAEQMSTPEGLAFLAKVGAVCCAGGAFLLCVRSDLSYVLCYKS
jgi:hypothetical protein